MLIIRNSEKIENLKKAMQSAAKCIEALTDKVEELNKLVNILVKTGEYKNYIKRFSCYYDYVSYCIEKNIHYKDVLTEPEFKLLKDTLYKTDY